MKLFKYYKYQFIILKDKFFRSIKIFNKKMKILNNDILISFFILEKNSKNYFYEMPCSNLHIYSKPK